MGIITKIETNTGEVKDLYLRVNNIDVNNHGADSLILIRGFISRDAFLAGKHFAHEESLEAKIDVEHLPWDQAYDVLKEKYPDHINVLE